MNSTYDVTYQYSPLYGGEWNTHPDLDERMANLLIGMLAELSRNCRVRQNATGEVREISLARGVCPPLLLNLFFKSISGRNGEVTE